jgi:hypothetical protein
MLPLAWTLVWLSMEHDRAVLSPRTAGTGRMVSTGLKLQILCLHGHAQTAEGFRAKTGSIRGPLKKIADFHFLEGRILLGMMHRACACTVPCHASTVDVCLCVCACVCMHVEGVV